MSPSLKMVETYKRTSNPMMNRPVVKAELVEWMRSSQTQITGELASLASVPVLTRLFPLV